MTELLRRKVKYHQEFQTRTGGVFFFLIISSLFFCIYQLQAFSSHLLCLCTVAFIATDWGFVSCHRIQTVCLCMRESQRGMYVCNRWDVGDKSLSFLCLCLGGERIQFSFCNLICVCCSMWSIRAPIWNGSNGFPMSVTTGVAKSTRTELTKRSHSTFWSW